MALQAALYALVDDGQMFFEEQRQILLRVADATITSVAADMRKMVADGAPHIRLLQNMRGSPLAAPGDHALVEC